MAFSLTAQINALRLVERTGAHNLKRAGIVSREAEGELLMKQIADARATLELIAADERVTTYLATARSKARS